MLVGVTAGCGGGGGGGGTTAQAAARTVAGDGFVVGVPEGWTVTKSPRSVLVEQGNGPALASVTVLPLLKTYRPALFTKAAVELDRVTGQLAAKLGGKVVARRTLPVGGRQARQYDLAYSRNGIGLIDRITYVLRRKSEYYLLCRWQTDQGEPSACATLTGSFRLR